jgi:HAD superfamily hydrolase (TIGR01459 family)
LTAFLSEVPAILEGIAGLAPRYDGFILDVWGVLHDGVAPYPGVIDALERLRDSGKRVVLLSNAPVRAGTVRSRLARLGIDSSLFQAIMTSGEEVWRSLSDRTDPFYAALGRRCLFVGPQRHDSMFDGLDLTLVEAPAAADFILNTGPDDLDDDATLYRALLEDAARRRVPMLCANADLHVMQGDTVIVCAGTLARIYEEMGGKVRWHGKPHASVYAACLDLLGPTDRPRILCVGDSLRTDIAGANAAGLDSLLVAGGMHAGDLGAAAGPLDPDRVRAWLGRHAPQPRWVIASLAW